MTAKELIENRLEMYEKERQRLFKVIKENETEPMAIRESALAMERFEIAIKELKFAIEVLELL